MSESHGQRTRVLSLKAQVDTSEVSRSQAQMVSAIKNMVRDVGQQMTQIQAHILRGFNLETADKNLKSTTLLVETLGSAAKENMGSLHDTSDDLKDVLKNLQSVMKEVSRAASSLSRRSSTASKSLEKFNTSATGLNAQLMISDAALNKAGDQAQTMAGQVLTLKGATDQVKSSVRSMNKEMVSDGWQRTSTGSQAAITSLKLANGQFDATTRIVRSLKNDLVDLGRIFTMNIAFWGVAIGYPAKQWADFQKEMLIGANLMGGAVRDVTKDMEALRKGFFDVGYANGIFAKEMAQATVELIRLGVKQKDLLDVQKVAADFALANSTTMEKAATLAVGSTQAMGYQMDQVGRVANVLSRVALDASADLDTLAVTMKYALPVSQSYQQSIEETGAFMDLLSKKMINNSIAGTTWRSAWVNLSKQTPEAKKWLDFFRVSVQNTDGSMRNMLDITQDLSKATKGLDPSFRNAGLAAIFGKTALTGMLAAINSTEQEVKAARDQMNNMNLSNDKMAEGMRKGVTFEFNQMRVAINQAAIEMGEVFEPTVISVLRSVRDLAVGFTELPRGLKQTIGDSTTFVGKITTMTIAMGTLTLAFLTAEKALKVLWSYFKGSVLFSFGAAIGKAAMGFVAFRSAVDAARVSMWLLNGAIAANPIGAFAIGVAALTFAILRLNQAFADLQEEKALENIVEQQEAMAKLRKETTEAAKEADKLRKNQTSPPPGGISATELRKAAYGYSKRRETAQQILYLTAATAREKIDPTEEKMRGYMSELSSRFLSPERRKEVEKLRDQAANELKTYIAQLKAVNALGADEERHRETALNEAAEELVNEAADNKKQRELRKKMNQVLEEANTIYKNRLQQLRKDALLQEGKRGERLPDQIAMGRLSGLWFGNQGFYPDSSNYSSQRMGAPRPGRTHAGNDLFDVDLPAGAAQGHAISKLPKDFKVLQATWEHFGGYIKLQDRMNKEIVIELLHTSAKSVDDFQKLVGKVAPKGTKIGLANLGKLNKDLNTAYVGTGPHLHLQGKKSGNLMNATALWEYFTGGSGVSSDKELDQIALAEKAKYIESRKGMFAEDAELAEEYARNIADVRSRIQDDANDLELERLKKQQADEKKLEEDAARESAKLFKDVFDLERDLQTKQAEIDKTTYTNRMQMIQESADLEIALAKDKYAQSTKLEEILAQINNKRQRQQDVVNKDEEANLVKRLKTVKNERETVGSTTAMKDLIESKRELSDLQKELEDKQTAKASENVLAYTKELIQYQQDLVTAKKSLLQLEDQEILNNHQMVRQENYLKALQVEYLKGNVSKVSLDEAELQNTKAQNNAIQLQIERYEKLPVLAAYLVGSENKLRELRQQQTDNIVRQNELLAASPYQELNIIEKQRTAGLLSQQQYLEKQIELLDQISNNSITVNGYDIKGLEANKQKGQAIQKLSLLNGDLVGYMKGIVLEHEKANNLQQVNWKLGEDININAEDLFNSLGSIGQGFANIGSTLLNIDGLFGSVAQEAQSFVSNLATGIAGIISGNPAAAIGGIVGALGDLAKVMRKAFPDVNEIVVQRTAFEAELNTIDGRIKKTINNLLALRGMLTQGEATERNRKIDQETYASDRQAKLAKKAQLEQQVKESSSAGFMDAIPGIGFFTAFAKAESAKKAREDLAKLNKELTADELEQDEKVAQAKKKQEEDDYDQSQLFSKKELEHQKYVAQQTLATVDDIQAERQGAFMDLANKQRQEVKDAEAKNGDLKKLGQLHYQEALDLNDKYYKQLEAAQTKDKLRKQQLDYADREHKLFMMEDSLEKQLAAIDLERDKKRDALEQEKADRILAGQSFQDLDTKLKNNDIERVKERERAWNEFLKNIVAASNQAAAELAVTFAKSTADELDDIQAEGNLQQVQLAESHRRRLESIKGNSQEANALKMTYEQQFARESSNLQQANNVKVMQHYMDKAKKIREVALIEAKSSKDITQAIGVEHQNQLKDLNDWYNLQVFLAEGNAEKKLEIDKEFAARKKEIEKTTNEKIIGYVNEQASRIKKLREDQFKLDTRQYELAIRREEKQLNFLERERDKLQKQIDEYDRKIEKMLEQFDEVDKTNFMESLRGMDITPELRAGLEEISNPQDLPNEVASLESWREAIKGRIDLLKQEAQNKRDLEEISEESYQKEIARINLIQAKFAQQVLDDPRFKAKRLETKMVLENGRWVEKQMQKEALSRTERADIESEMAEAYVAYQQANQEAIRQTYNSEKKALAKSIKSNEEQQAVVQQNIKDNQNAIADLRYVYEDDTMAIENQVDKIEQAHRDWSISINDVRNNYAALVSQIPVQVEAMAAKMSQAISSIPPWPKMPNYNLTYEQSWLAQNPGMDLGAVNQNSGRSIMDSVSVSPDGRVIQGSFYGQKKVIVRDRSQGADFIVDGGDGWYYVSDSDAESARMSGFKDGGITPLAGRSGDIYPGLFGKQEVIMPLKELPRVMSQLGLSMPSKGVIVNIQGNYINSELDLERLAIKAFKKVQASDTATNLSYVGPIF